MKTIEFTDQEIKFFVSFLERRKMYKPYNNGVWEEWMESTLKKMTFEKSIIVYGGDSILPVGGCGHEKTRAYPPAR